MRSTSLRSRAPEHEIADGLTACQFAIARGGEVLTFESFGTADDETRFGVASATKPIVASATWHLIGEGLLDVGCRVVDYVPGFGTHGKDVVTVEQVFVMTSGFPNAAMAPEEGADPARRRDRFALGARIRTGHARTCTTERPRTGCSPSSWNSSRGMDFRDYIEQRVTEPLGLPRLLGIPRDQQTNIAPFSLPGQPDAAAR